MNKVIISIVLCLCAALSFGQNGQAVDIRVPTTIKSSENADSLGGRSPDFFVDTLTVQDVYGVKTIKHKIILDSTLGIGVSTPDPSSIIDISSTGRGLLMPRMTDVQRDAISTPAEGLHVFDNVNNVPNFYNGTTWRRFSHTTSASLEDGGVVIGENGSGIYTDSINLYWDNIDKKLGIGTDAPGVRLTIEGGISIGDTTGFVLSNDSAIVTSESNVILDTEGGAAVDTLAVLTGVIGQIVYISTRNSGRDIAIMDADKFSLSVNRILNNPSDVLVLKATSTTEWKEISFSNNGN